MIYTLRHCERNKEDVFFNCSLNELGLENSVKIIKNIEEINPTYIFVSPYKRTIQTILPYCIKNKKKIIIDYSISEYFDNSKNNNNNDNNIKEFYKHDFYNDFKEYVDYDNSNINNNINLLINENYETFSNRIINFYDKIKNINKLNENKHNILIVSHQAPINRLYMINNNNIDLSNFYTMGSIKELS